MRARRRKVKFSTDHARSSAGQSSRKHTPSQSLRLPQELMADHARHTVNIPPAFVSFPALADPVSTSTSTAQVKTIEECLPLLRAAYDNPQDALDLNWFGVPRLDRDGHVEFLENALGQFPANFVGIDSSRPWMVYWGLLGLYFLGEDTSSYADR